jgi:hypothetical protein
MYACLTRYIQLVIITDGEYLTIASLSASLVTEDRYIILGYN